MISNFFSPNGEPAIKQALLDRHDLQWVFAAFYGLTLPLLIMHFFAADFLQKVPLDVLLFILLGLSHFLITCSLYLSKDHFRYFNSSWQRRGIYFGMPLIFITFYCSIQWATVGKEEVATTLRLVNDFHWTRQSFGVALLIGGAGIANSRKILNAFFYLSGFFLSLSLFFENHLVWIAGIMLCFLGLAYLKRKSLSPEIRIYLLLQALAFCIACIDERLYLIALSMHYVEYHILMAKRRPIRPAANPSCPEFFHRWSSYAILLIFTILAAQLLNYANQPPPRWNSTMAAAANAIFAIHFFLDAFIWRFKNSFYQSEFAGILSQTRGGS